jgi:hypothetical protein
LTGLCPACQRPPGGTCQCAWNLAATGNARYAEARRRALQQTGDPQHDARAALARRAGQLERAGRITSGADLDPCACTGNDSLPHTGLVHHLTGPGKAHPRGRRTYCTVASADGPCSCESYRPVTTANG